ncbi:MAG: ribose 5-phosphate isomerase B [Bacteroidales bacterium]|nr:ribose 5-phosphate isomerase B [Bacteroidales bacterium]
MNREKRIALASDHAGFKMKQQIIKHLKTQGVNYDDLGTHSDDAVDYSDFGHLLGKSVAEGGYSMGISICGTGNGINMTTNKHTGIRGAICWNEEIATLARSHNDANICSLPARFIDTETAVKIVDIFMQTEFDGGRHERRIRKIDI